MKKLFISSIIILFSINTILGGAKKSLANIEQEYSIHYLKKIFSNNFIFRNNQIVANNSAKYVLDYTIPNAADHANTVTSVAVSGDYIISGSSDNTIKVWNLKTGILERNITPIRIVAQINSVAVSGNHIISGRNDNTIQVLNLKTGALERTLTGHIKDTKLEFPDGRGNLATYYVGSVRSVAATKDLIISSGTDKTLRFWNLKTGTLERTIPNPSGQINEVVVNDEKIITRDSDKTIKVWNLKTGVLEASFTAHEASITSIAASRDYIVSGSSDNTIKVWRLAK